MIVIDTSALVAALRNFGPVGDEVRRILAQHEQLAAPPHQPAEVLNTFRGLARGSVLAADIAFQAVEDYINLGVMLVELDADMAVRAWQLRENLTGYDALYVALAEKLGCELVTGDTKLARANMAQCSVVTVEADF